jgi:8-oxo-dGTP pyrophosphatase MutT (NUDIX family)
VSSWSEAPLSPAARDLAEVLLSPSEAEEIEAHGTTDAAVLIPLYDWPEAPGLIFTERLGTLRRHAGEISFPGGRRDHPEEDLIDCALREAQEEIGLDPTIVEVAGALPPVPTMVTGFKVHPFVGIVPAGLELVPSPIEVERILHIGIDELHAGFGSRRLVRHGVPFRSDTYLVGEHLIWGATARIVKELLGRLAAA